MCYSRVKYFVDRPTKVKLVSRGRAMETDIFVNQKEEDTVDTESFQGMYAFSRLKNVFPFLVNQSV